MRQGTWTYMEDQAEPKLAHLKFLLCSIEYYCPVKSPVSKTNNGIHSGSSQNQKYAYTYILKFPVKQVINANAERDPENRPNNASKMEVGL